MGWGGFLSVWPDLGRITGAQRETLLLVAAGKTDQAIAHVLGVSERAIVKRLAVLRTRARVSCRTALAVVALKLGWIDLDEIEVDYVD